MKKIHFIAIGGAIMHQLAIALSKQGYLVTGSDDEINDPAKTNLKNTGLLPDNPGWFPEKIHAGLTSVVLGMHARADNPELLEAQRIGIPVYSFPEYIYEVSRNKQRVVVAGSHGKTTITSMIMHILKKTGLDFDYLVGAKIPGFDQSVRLSEAPVIVLEGDEYPASVVEKKPKILFYHPALTVISGIAWDHINVFPTYEIYFNQFVQYLNGLAVGTTVYYNAEDPEVVRLINVAGSDKKCIPYKTPEFHYDEGYPVLQTAAGPKKISVFGRHNVLNIQAAIGVCGELGITEEKCIEAIADFTGAARRLEKVLERPGLRIYRDFAHAPSKLKATLDAVREAYPGYLLVACFELHTFSSLNRDFLHEYAGSMNGADKPVVFFSHHALSLKGLPALDKNIVRQEFGREDLIVCDDRQKLEALIPELTTSSDKNVFLLLMSSGTFDGIDWNTLYSQS
jgi:UDP-N-acetylmuramate: L-alanyl-gamma-D-glutamyl-meso-diaminopimelate ligase